MADSKAEGAFRTIGEVTEALGLRAHVLRYWEGQFPMLRPVKRAGGRRLYRPDMELLATIDRLVHREVYAARCARFQSQGREATPAEVLLADLRRVRARLAAALG
jgi:DNA-binding transcriptional MerR regulator